MQAVLGKEYVCRSQCLLQWISCKHEIPTTAFICELGAGRSKYYSSIILSQKPAELSASKLAIDICKLPLSYRWTEIEPSSENPYRVYVQRRAALVTQLDNVHTINADLEESRVTQMYASVGSLVLGSYFSARLFKNNYTQKFHVWAAVAITMLLGKAGCPGRIRPSTRSKAKATKLYAIVKRCEKTFIIWWEWRGKHEICLFRYLIWN